MTERPVSGIIIREILFFKPQSMNHTSDTTGCSETFVWKRGYDIYRLLDEAVDFELHN